MSRFFDQQAVAVPLGEIDREKPTRSWKVRTAKLERCASFVSASYDSGLFWRILPRYRLAPAGQGIPCQTVDGGIGINLTK
jgi:hypothetical protein